MNYNIRIATIDDINDVVDSNLRHLNEPGFNKLPVHPFSRDQIFNRQSIYNEYLHPWSIEVGDREWGRTFIVETNLIVRGYLNIRNSPPNLSHQASLGMGLEMEIRRQKIGPQLLNYSLEWIKNFTNLSEVNLTVFSHNMPARKIYEQAGFILIGEIKNKFQIDNLRIDDITMTYQIVR